MADEGHVPLPLEYKADSERAGKLIVFWNGPSLQSDEAERLADGFTKRQESRLSLVGSDPATAPIIEQSFTQIVGILDSCLRRRPFLLGSRPSLADFAMFGQLSQLGMIDPTPAFLMFTQSPRLRAWLDLVEDLSGIEPEEVHWSDIETLDPELNALLAEIGRTYIPLLLANEIAIENGDSTLRA